MRVTSLSKAIFLCGTLSIAACGTTTSGGKSKTDTINIVNNNTPSSAAHVLQFMHDGCAGARVFLNTERLLAIDGLAQPLNELRQVIRSKGRKAPRDLREFAQIDAGLSALNVDILKTTRQFALCADERMRRFTVAALGKFDSIDVLDVIQRFAATAGAQLERETIDGIPHLLLDRGKVRVGMVHKEVLAATDHKDIRLAQLREGKDVRQTWGVQPDHLLTVSFVTRKMVLEGSLTHQDGNLLAHVRFRSLKDLSFEEVEQKLKKPLQVLASSIEDAALKKVLTKLVSTPFKNDNGTIVIDIQLSVSELGDAIRSLANPTGILFGKEEEPVMPQPPPEAPVETPRQ